MTSGGYRDPAYAASLDAWGEPVRLPASGGSVLARPLPGGGGERDAIGPYPVFLCRDWSALGSDLADLRDRLVCLSLVADPFGDHDPALLARTFPDLCRPFKTHFAVDLDRFDPRALPENHRRNRARAARAVTVGEEEPEGFLDDWCRLYGHLVERHAIGGLQRFSPAIFARQMRVPGLTVFSARREGVPVGAALFLQTDAVVYYHLAGYAPEGYDAKASFALFDAAIEHFRGRARFLSLGAAAGAAEADDGLSRFKRGWANHTRTAYLCGAVLTPAVYRERAARLPPTSYFPAYRQGEFG